MRAVKRFTLWTTQGAGTLQNAEYTVRYYDGQVSGSPLRTWVFRTDSDGFIYFDNIHKVSGDEFFLDSFGSPSIPVGTITVQETKAPAGYLINSDVYTVRFSLQEDGTVRSDKGTWNTANGLEDLSLVSEETAVYGGVRIRKTDSVTGNTESSIGSSLAGAEITIYNNCGKTITLRDGSQAANGAAVLTVKTAADGSAQTSADALPYGTYYAKETAAPAGYAVNRSWRADFSITEAEKIVNASPDLAETPLAGALSVTKTDSAGSSAQGDASLSGISFAVVNRSAGSLRIGNATVAPGAVVAVITTDADGRAATAAGALPYGSYAVYELRADASFAVGDSYSDASKLGSSGLANDKGYRFREESRTFSITTGGQTAAAAFSDEVVTGIPEIIKTGEGGILQQGNASAEGIRFALVNDSAGPVVIGGRAYAKGTVVDILTVSKDGKTQGRPLPYGTYTAFELRADATVETGDAYRGSDKLGSSLLANGNGYLFREQSRNIVIRQQDAVVSVSFEDAVVRGGISVHKTAAGGAQGDVSTEGVSFAVVNMSEEPVYVEGIAAAKGAVAAIITTDGSGMASTASDALPYGKYAVYELRSDASIEAGDIYSAFSGLGSSDLANAGGLLFEEQSAEASVTENGAVTVLSFSDEIARGGVRIVKQDKDLKESIPQGDASLAGIVFEIVNRSGAAVTVDGTVCEPGSAVMTVETGPDGTAVSPMMLPFGTYEIREKASNGSYLLTDTESRTVRIRENGVIAEPEGSEFRNEVVRGGVSFQKVDAETGEAVPFGPGTLAGVEITIYNDSGNIVVVGGKEYAPGEAVLTLTTDEEGRCASAADALPYGSYRAAETRASEGYEINTEWNAAFRIRENGVVADTSENSVLREKRIPAEIRTSAKDGHTGDREGIAVGEDVIIADEVVMTGLLAGKEYTLKGRLVDRDAGSADEPVYIGEEVTKTFTAPDGMAPGDKFTEIVEFILPEEILRGKTVVVFEALYSGGDEIAVHADLSDEDQAVSYSDPKLRTTALDPATGKHTGLTDCVTASIKDTVRVTGLKGGEEYTLSGRLIDADASGDGKTVFIEGTERNVTFMAGEGETEKTVEMVFTVDAEKALGKKVVVSETLLIGEYVLAVHEDPNDEDQTVEYPVPAIRTVAAGPDGSGEIVPDEDGKGVIVDTISVENVRPGTEITARGILVERNSGEALMDDEGNVYEAETSAVISSSEDSIEVTFTIEVIERLAGTEIVVFERLYLAGTDKLIASHEDIEDAAQTVSVPVPPEIPKTGDRSGPLLYAGAFIAALLCASALASGRRKDR